MDEEFVGRRRELELLDNAYHSPRSEFIPIYGRRRVGKSELILRFLHDKSGLYFTGKRAPAAMQLQEFAQAAAIAMREPLLAQMHTEHWGTLLSAVVDRWKGPEKLILALDEFQWIAAASPELPSVLQELWDRTWRRGGKVLLILCGSFIGFMEREVLGQQSPLFGRRTAQMLLQPFDYLEAAEFHPTYALPEQAKTYFICGGIPLYLRYFASSKSVETNLIENVLEEFGPLHREPEFLLREELRDVENYYAILLTVAAGSPTNREISAQTGIGERSLHYYLQTLVDLGYLTRRYPLTGGRSVARHVRYAIADPLLRFWFRFVSPNTSLLLQLGSERVWRERIRPEMDAYYGGCFERLCREALPRLYAKEKVSGSFQVGEYWDKQTQIDVVGLREDGWTDIGECKWGPIRSVNAITKELEDKVPRYPNSRNATIGRRIFSQKPVPAAVKRASKIRWHSLADLYALKRTKHSSDGR